MVNNYLKVLARVKTPTGQPGAVVRKPEYIPFDDSSAADTLRARTAALIARAGIEGSGLIPVMSLHRPCSLTSRGDREFTLVGEFVEFGDGR